MSSPFTDTAPLAEAELERRLRERLAEEQARREAEQAHDTPATPQQPLASGDEPR